MPKRSSKPPKGEDENEAAFRIMQEATRDDDAPEEESPPESVPEKNPAAVALGRLGGKKGGKARAEKLTPERRSAIAKAAARARWKKNASKRDGGEQN